MTKRLTLLLPALTILMVACEGPQRTSDLTAADTSGSPPSDAPLVIGTAASAAPIAYRNDGVLVGLEIDLANELARRLGRTPRIVSMFFPNLPNELQQGRIDIIMTGFSITPARAERMAFAEPYLETGQKAMIRRADVARFPSAERLDRAGVTLGVEQGTSGAAYAKASMPQARTVTFATIGKAASALREGRVDAVIHDAPVIQWLVRHDGRASLNPMPGLLTNESLAWAVSRDNPELLSQVNAALAEMKSDGTLAELIEKWMGTE